MSGCKGCGCAGDGPQIFANTYGDAWGRGIGSRKKTLELDLNEIEHVDGSQWKIARLLPNMVFDDIKVRTAGIADVTVDLGFSDTCRSCCCTESEQEGNEELTWFAEALDVGAAKECLLEGGPWDAASGHCAPECCKPCDDEECPDDKAAGPVCAWDLILTIHGDVAACSKLVITFDYHNE